MRESISPIRVFTFLAFLLLAMASCSHKYDSDELDLSFYQWNKWVDPEAPVKSPDVYPPPSCGWEEFNRGKGDLVRIPSPVGKREGITWFHCRFTLPEEWEERPIQLKFEGAKPEMVVYLNEQLAGVFRYAEQPVTANVTELIFYTLDNHLAIGIIVTDDVTASGEAGITGKIWVRAIPDPRSVRNTGD